MLHSPLLFKGDGRYQEEREEYEAEDVWIQRVIVRWEFRFITFKASLATFQIISFRIEQIVSF